MSKKLISLDKWNKSREDIYQPPPNIPNGILCPRCVSAELVDPNPYNVVPTIPPLMDVECLACGYKGTRIA